MKNLQYPCFVFAFERVRDAHLERSTAGFIVHDNELEMLLHLLPEDYIRCLRDYKKELDNIDEMLKNGSITKERLIEHRRSLENVLEMMVPLGDLRKVNTDDIYYDGDKGVLLNEAKILTGLCFTKSMYLAERIEGIMKREDIIFLADEGDDRKRYKSELEYMFYEDNVNLFNKLRDFITKSQAIRKKNKPINDALYMKIVRWGKELDDLPDYTKLDISDEDKKKYDVIEGLRIKCFDEINHLSRVYEAQKRNGEKTFSGERIERPIRNIKIEGYSGSFNKINQGIETHTETKELLDREKKEDKNKQWWKDPNAWHYQD